MTGDGVGGGGGLTAADAADARNFARSGEPGGGGRGGDCVLPPFVADAAPTCIRTVSRGAAALGGTRGGSVIRTVSFLGSSESLMRAEKLLEEAC
jgi:hypothetical protein